jgi:hypothetical protein
MPHFRVAMIIVCLAVPSLYAQTLPPVPDPPAVDVAVPQQQEPSPVAEPEQKLPIFRQSPRADGSRAIQTNVVVTNGELLLDSPPAPSTGVLLGGFAATPDIFARLGTSTSASSFNVTTSGNLSLFKVRGDGYVLLRKDQDALTTFELNNANTGAGVATTGTSLRFLEGTTPKGALTAIGSANSTQAGGANALQLWNLANGATIFLNSGSERMRINSNGYVTLNAAGAPEARLFVQHGIDNSTAVYVTHQPAVEAASGQVDTGIYSQVTENVYAGVTNSGLVISSRNRGFLTGPGTLSSMIGSFVETGTSGGSEVAGAVISSSVGLRVDSFRAANTTVTNGYGVYLSDVLATNDYGIYQVSATDTNYFAGQVVIGGTIASVPPAYAGNALNVEGNANFNGTVTGTNIQAKFQDVAEWVPSREDLAPGTVVILDPRVRNTVTASDAAYDTTVAGVISAEPGIILGVGAANKEKVSTTGRVRVKVDATSAPIRIGDLLVTSGITGTAMKSAPLSLGGISIHRPGTIIGKALEPLESGTGEILVLLSLQ